jgi:SEC-C motif-containing protein
VAVIISHVPDALELCPCGSAAAFEKCCGPVVRGERPAPTAERLMRSRFTAFAVGDEAHLLRSWHPSTRPATLQLVAGQRWTSLQVLATVAGELLDREGEVEFRAHYERRGLAGVLHELSRFGRDDEGRWVYIGPVEAELG